MDGEAQEEEMRRGKETARGSGGGGVEGGWKRSRWRRSSSVVGGRYRCDKGEDDGFRPEAASLACVCSCLTKPGSPSDCAPEHVSRRSQQPAR